MTQIDQPPAVAAIAPHGGHSWKWWMAGVLFLATLLTYLDRQTLSICKEMICTEFQLNDKQYGELLASFRWSYALMQLPAGIMADHLPLRSTFGLAVGLWSLAGAAAAGVFRLPTLMVTRGVLGMGECFNWPCSSRIVANTFQPSDRSLASGIFNSGAALGSLLAPAIIGGLALAFGWRAAFITMGALGAVWLVLWFIVTDRSSPCHSAVRSKVKFSLVGQCWYAVVFLAVGIGLPALVILQGPRLIGHIQAVFPGAAGLLSVLQGLIIPALVATVAVSLVCWRTKAIAFWMLLLVTMTVNPCWYFMNEWLINTLREDRHLGDKGIGGALAVTTMVMLIADLGNLVSGAVIKRLIRGGWTLRAARRAAMIGAGCAIAPVSIVGYIDNLALATIMFGLAGMGITSIIAAFTACQQDLSFKRVGMTSGIIGMTANIISAIANPMIGAHHDATHSFRLMFVLLGTLPLVGAAAVIVFDALIHGEGAKHAKAS